METIKLLIWDLDETFWNGTISDGEIEPIQKNIDLIKELTNRGIVNSICSKNDFNVAKTKLEELGVWEYFVFPSIDWTNKGVRVKNIIADMQLRPVNCLFIDDNKNNLEEAKFISPEIQTCLPQELEELVKDPAFKGKDDSKHSRLNQYKILEQKAEARSHAGSNEEFLFQSNIKVELIEKVDDKLERIHEMIHRNNQLNFTKDRISKEEVDALFTDPTVKCGVIHVSDNFGDHGIVGCYAVKDGRAVQLVLSCRILGMGVEQWVYSEIGYPELTVVGEVASELNKTDRPAWINQSLTEKNDIETKKENTPKLIVYGTCPLRPVWAYVEPKLKEPKFAEIDPAPSVMNLAVALRESKEQLNEWLDGINIFDKINTFDQEIIDGKADYILATLYYEFSFIKYTKKETNKRFYSVKLDDSFTKKSILENHSAEIVSEKDIYEELTYLCKHLSPKTTLILMTVPEIEFLSMGKDDNYNKRLKLNKIAEQVASENNNIKILDIRKYTNSQSDFFDLRADHYNRAIGFSLANEVLNFMNVINKTDDKREKAIPYKKCSARLGDNEIFYKECLCNGKYYLDINLDSSKYEFKYEISRNRFTESKLDYSNQNQLSFDINKEGLWRINVSIKNLSTKESFSFYTKTIDYNLYNYYSFIDENVDNYETFMGSLNQFTSDSQSSYKTYKNICEQTADLAAAGVNVTQYFIDKGITEISIFTDKKIGPLILPFFANSSIKIKTIYTTDWIWNFNVLGSTQIYTAQYINWGPCPSKNEHMFFAFDNYQRFSIINSFKNSQANKYYLQNIFNSLMTKYVFCKSLKNINFISLRVPDIGRSFSFDYKMLTSNEKITSLILKNENYLIENITKLKDKLPPQYKGYTDKKILEVFKRPIFYSENKYLQKMKDISGIYLNIKNGFRVTPNNDIEEPIGTIYIVGGTQAFGLGVADDETISYYLQSILEKRYRVVNFANCINTHDYSNMIKLVNNTKFEENDIVIFIQANWRTNDAPDFLHYLDWDSFVEPIIKLDAFPLFEKQDRPDYFLLPNAFTKECNLQLAKLINDYIEKNI